MPANNHDGVEIPTGDRGKTPYFHGRSGVLRKFDRILSSAVVAGEGTIQLIQGAPGAGKTALVDQMERVATGRGWKSVEIDPQALWDVDALREFFPDRNILRKVSAKVIAGLSVISVDLGIKRSSKTIKKILRSGNCPLLLILDEAQMLGSSSKPVGVQALVASSVLKAIHNGKIGAPIILVAAGLKTTLTSLQALDVSRFGERNKAVLSRLSEESAVR